ncbi:MAG: TetR/AcrR family transcriptional regulator [Thermodesulfobacteriota bacterium]
MTKKEAILKAAEELFGELGYTETTFKKIASRAEVALGLVAHHFENKEKLFIAAGLDVLSQLRQSLREEIAKADNGLEGVLYFSRRYLEFSLQESNHFMVLIRCSPFSDMKDNVNKETIGAKFTELYTDLQNCIALGLEDGSIHPEVEPEPTAYNVLANLSGSVRTQLLHPYAPPEFYAWALRFIERSLAPPEHRTATESV